MLTRDSSAITETFDRLQSQQEMALIPYLTAGFPTLDDSIELLKQMSDSGADIVEMGIPFSDPVADGPTIQYSSQIALEHGIKLGDIIHHLSNAKISKPIVLMSYLNPLLTYTPQRLFKDMASAGIAGLIVPDLPPEEAGEWLEQTRQHGISLILLVAPTSSDERIGRIADCCDTFLYYVTITGTTGARRSLPEDLTESLKRVRQLAKKPVVAGFGISEPAHVRALQGHADGVVIGSRFVEAVKTGEDVSKLTHNLKQATRSS